MKSKILLLSRLTARCHRAAGYVRPAPHNPSHGTAVPKSERLWGHPTPEAGCIYAIGLCVFSSNVMAMN